MAIRFWVSQSTVPNDPPPPTPSHQDKHLSTLVLPNVPPSSGHRNGGKTRNAAGGLLPTCFAPSQAPSVAVADAEPALQPLQPLQPLPTVLPHSHDRQESPPGDRPLPTFAPASIPAPLSSLVCGCDHMCERACMSVCVCMCLFVSVCVYMCLHVSACL